MDFRCKRCGQTFRYKHYLETHLQRRYPCEATIHDIHPEILMKELERIKKSTDVFECRYCDKTFAYIASRCRHEKTCKQVHAENASLKRRIAELESRVAQQNITNNTTINNTPTVNITANITIPNINDFGNESLHHLTDDFVAKCLKSRVNGVVELLKCIHFSDDVPQNKNIRIRSTKHNTVDVIEDGRWTIKDFNQVSFLMTKKSAHVMSKYYNTGDREFDPDTIEFLTLLVDPKSKKNKSSIASIKALLMNQREIESSAIITH